MIQQGSSITELRLDALPPKIVAAKIRVDRFAHRPASPQPSFVVCGVTPFVNPSQDRASSLARFVEVHLGRRPDAVFAFPTIRGDVPDKIPGAPPVWSPWTVWLDAQGEARKLRVEDDDFLRRRRTVACLC
jgi:hypothetical protein